MPSSPEIQRIAERMDRERRAIERTGVRSAARIGREVRLAALRAYRAHRDPSLAVRQTLQPLHDLLADAMVLGHLRGRRRAALRASEAMKSLPRVQLSTVYEGAIQTLRRQQSITPEQIAMLRQVYGPEVVKVLGTLTGSLGERINKAMARIAEDGLHVRAGMAELRQAFNASGITPENSFTLENLLRTQTQIAYAAGRANVLAEPEIDEILWGYEYVSVGDDRVRPSHAAMDGIRLPKDDPFWLTHMPPNGYSCRCTVIEIFKGDRQARQKPPATRIIDGEPVEPRPDRGFEFHPGQLFRDGIAAQQRS